MRNKSGDIKLSIFFHLEKPKGVQETVDEESRT